MAGEEKEEAKTMATLCLALKSIGNGHVTDDQIAALQNVAVIKHIVLVPPT